MWETEGVGDLRQGSECKVKINWKILGKVAINKIGTKEMGRKHEKSISNL